MSYPFSTLNDSWEKAVPGFFAVFYIRGIATEMTFFGDGPHIINDIHSDDTDEGKKGAMPLSHIREDDDERAHGDPPS